MTDPKRLLDEGATAAELRMLRAWKIDGPLPESKAAALMALAGTLSMPATSSAGAHVTAAGGASTSKLAVGTAGLLKVAGASVAALAAVVTAAYTLSPSSA